MADKLKRKGKAPEPPKVSATGNRSTQRRRRASGNTKTGLRMKGGMGPFSSIVVFLVIAVCLWINFNETVYSPGGIMWARGVLEHSVIMFAGYLLGANGRKQSP